MTTGDATSVPAFSGLFAPHWHPEARGIITGLTSYITKGHPARAVLEATGWPTREVIDTTIERPIVAETVSLGAAYAAGLSVGYWPDLAALRRNWHRAARWTPTMEPSDRETECGNWKRAVQRQLQRDSDDARAQPRRLAAVARARGRAVDT